MKTTKTIPNIIEIDCMTGEQIVRPMTAEEHATFLADQEAANQKAQDLALKEKARQDLFDRLGLTIDELTALGLG